MRYIYTSFVFFFLAGLTALLMRAQLAQPNAHVLGPSIYNELFTMHGTTMIFLFNTPVLAGFGNYLIPLQLGTRDMAFPAAQRVQLLGVPVRRAVHVRQLLRRPDARRRLVRLRAPRLDKTFYPGMNIDFWGLGIVFVGPLDHRRLGQLHRHHLQDARARA